MATRQRREGLHARLQEERLGGAVTSREESQAGLDKPADLTCLTPTWKPGDRRACGSVHTGQPPAAESRVGKAGAAGEL